MPKIDRRDHDSTSAPRYCRCGPGAPAGPLGRCPRCGFAAPPAAEVVWAEEAAATNARTTPPRHAEHAAMALYGRIARRNPARPRSRFGWPSLILSGVLFLLAAAIYPVDAALLHLASGGLAFAGLVAGIKGLLGH